MEKASELIHKQQEPAQSQYGILEAYKLHFDGIMLLEACLLTKSISKKKIRRKAWYRILGAEISSHEKFHCKTTQISESNLVKSKLALRISKFLNL